jgi:hypothetical protein
MILSRIHASYRDLHVSRLQLIYFFLKKLQLIPFSRITRYQFIFNLLFPDCRLRPSAAISPILTPKHPLLGEEREQNFPKKSWSPAVACIPPCIPPCIVPLCHRLQLGHRRIVTRLRVRRWLLGLRRVVLLRHRA